jgi:hypothetical protein
MQIPFATLREITARSAVVHRGVSLPSSALGIGKTMNTALRYLFFFILGCSLGQLGAVLDLTKQRDRALEFIGANPPNQYSKGLEPILGTPTQIQAKLDSLMDQRPTTESQSSDLRFMRSAFNWLKSDADERIRVVRSGSRSLALLSVSLISLMLLPSPRKTLG